MAGIRIVETEHPLAGPMREPQPAAKFAVTPAQPQHPAPGVGQHTDAVLAELGYAADETASLHADGCVS